MTVRRQMVVVEYHAPDWWAMLPDGTVAVFDTAAAAFAEVQRAALRGNRGVTITKIEWRDVPAGFTPPTRGEGD